MTEFAVRPLGERIIIKKADSKEVSEGGIHLPQNMQENDDTQIGEVLAVGDVEKVSVGDKVIFGRFGGNTIEVENEKVIVMNINDVLAVYNT